MTSSERNDAALCHFLGLLGFVGSGYLGIIGPLVWWLMRKDTSSFVDQQGKESLNFQLTILILETVFAPLCLILVGIPFEIGFFVMSLVFPIVGGVKVSNGEAYRYPVNFRIIK